ncbi:MAG: bifunctional precorrin-2 dehydrogenase/sirohydrochlorin ferrochelatase [Clostridium sp.]
MINLKNKEVVIIGGGNVALRKAKKFLEYEANVKVISKNFAEGFKLLYSDYKGKLVLIKGVFHESFIEKSFLVVAATDDGNLNKYISTYCMDKNILCNVADSMELSDFIVPSTIKSGDLTISISTLGNSPSLCAKIRKELQSVYDESYGEYVDLLGQCRKIILENFKDEGEKKRILNSLIDFNKEELQDLMKRNFRV